MKCEHQRKTYRWVEEEDYHTGEVTRYQDWFTESTTEDIDIGRYKCTQCGEVMYYTGTWRKHWTGE